MKDRPTSRFIVTKMQREKSKIIISPCNRDDVGYSTEIISMLKVIAVAVVRNTNQMRRVYRQDDQDPLYRPETDLLVPTILLTKSQSWRNILVYSFVFTV